MSHPPDVPSSVFTRAHRPHRPAAAARRFVGIVAAMFGAAGVAAPVGAQGSRPAPHAVDRAAPGVAAVTESASGPWLDLPFGVGERLEYDAKVGPLRVGRGHMEVVGVELVRGREALHIAFRVSGGALGIRVSDAMDSWVDPRSFTSLRFVQELRERGKERDRRFEIYPERGVYVEEGKDEAPTAAHPLDDGAFFYFVRTVPLVVGETYTFDRYFRPDRNPVTVRVLRRERVTVPAGEFDAVVIQPIIQTKGLFAESRRTELWLSDDERRVLLKMQTQLPFGSLSLHLRRDASRGAGTAP